jgi:hypothetical protein
VRTKTYPRALARLAIVLSALALSGALPARADERIHSEANPGHTDTGGGLLLLSFLLLPGLPLALVAPPSASRPPVATSPAVNASHRPPAPAAPAQQVAKRASN